MSPKLENDRIQNGGYQIGGVGRSRTDDPLLAKQVLYQLSYDPVYGVVTLKEHNFLKFTLCDQSEPRRQQKLIYSFLRP